ncbi:CRYAA [Cordylochernes scorpioides]|uniref:CRYAA n=1 Tax=Cordylochernes scorpioides TaxID=51811 RepID=A0ABY6K4Q4_9ARAC|nr:CRYAA [Cordylochernes scorpioides]
MEDPLDDLLALPQHQSEVVHSDDKFQVHLDVSNYRPEELSVKMVAVVVRGKQEKKDGHSWVSREFNRRYSLPPDVDSQALTSTLTPQGVLTLEAPKMEPPGDQAVEQMAVEDKSGDQ